ncbi:MAG: hypothetical protein M3023_04760 [Pseudomonadota bacterium]|nr:hypothetical protein [Pseudomonadota bacterium]
MPDRPAARLAQAQTWGSIAIALALYAVLRMVFGPLPQDPSYHVLADTRMCGPIPRAGDVLTNLSILAAGIMGLALARRVHVTPCERAAFTLLVAGMLLTALGSAYYHWAPSDARLVWDRLPMTLVIAALLTLLLADRIDPAFAGVALWPIAALGAASVLWWAWTRQHGADDLLLYLIVRIGTGIAIAFLLLLRRGRSSGAGWLWAALTLDLTMTVAERFDRAIFDATGKVVSGHNVKHLLAGALLGCVLAWLALREPVAQSRGPIPGTLA